MKAVNLEKSLETFDEHWRHRLVGRINNMDVKVVKIQGEFVWHSHDFEDEMFFVVQGKLRMHFRNKTVDVNPGEFIIVPHGAEHKPEGLVETHIMLVEPSETVNTGNAEPSHFTHKPQEL